MPHQEAERERAAAVGEGDDQDHQPDRDEDQREGADGAAVDALAAHRVDLAPGPAPGIAGGLSVGSETTITRQGRSPRIVCRVLS